MLITDPSHAPPRRLILASQSPRRQELMRVLGWPFDVIPSTVDESTAPEALTPAQLASWLAERKAEDVASRHPGAVVVGADTMVVLGSLVMGKPADIDDARRMLRTLPGLPHQVITGI